MVKPKLEDYNVNVLCIIGNQAVDSNYRDLILSLIVDKIVKNDYPLFFLVNCFKFSDLIIKEAYAEVIVRKMKDVEYDIEDELLFNILNIVSIDCLFYYGMESSSLVFRNKCKDEFWKRVLEYGQTNKKNGCQIKKIK